MKDVVDLFNDKNYGRYARDTRRALSVYELQKFERDSAKTEAKKILNGLEPESAFYIIGMKPAGGISTSKIALQYLVMLNEVLGEQWMNKTYFRFGASSLANDILMQLVKSETGFYQSANYFSKD